MREFPPRASTPAANRSINVEVELGGLLQQVYALIYDDETKEALDLLLRGLEGLRQAASAEEWNQICAITRAHPVAEIIHQDPFTQRCFAKPRGYAGDAVMLDIVYGEAPTEPINGKCGEMTDRVAAYTMSSPSSHSTRARRLVVAEAIDAVAIKPNAEVLAFACGHLREAEQSWAVQNRRLARFVAIDQDLQSLQVVKNAYGRLGVEATPGSVRDILKGTCNPGQFDLVYTTGLFDYMTDEVASKLIRGLFALVKPGGSLLIGNFAPNGAERGFMEALMDWRLVYRDVRAMETLAGQLDPRAVNTSRAWADRYGRICYLEVTRAVAPVEVAAGKVNRAIAHEITERLPRSSYAQ